MRKLFHYPLRICLLLAVIFGLTLVWQHDTLADTISFQGGDGYESNPYIIGTPEQLYNVSVNQSVYATDNFMLSSDIDFTNWDWNSNPWTPIGNSSSPFTGTFDGAGHVIKGLMLNSTSFDSAGMFGKNSGIIRNIGLEDVDIVGASDTGSLVGLNIGKIHHAYSTGIVSGTSYSHIGGLVGRNYGSGIVQHSYSNANVSGSNDVGGLVGMNESGGILQSVFATGNASGIVHVGGLLGMNNGTLSTVRYAYATGNASCTTYDAGGLIGHINSGSLTEYVFATGDVAGSINNTAGGLIGYSDSGTIHYGFYRSDNRSISWFGQNYGIASNISSKTLDELKQIPTFSDWNSFEDQWWILDRIQMPAPSDSSYLQNVDTSSYLSNQQSLSLNGEWIDSEGEFLEGTKLHVMLLNNNNQEIAEAIWSSMTLSWEGEWQTSLAYPQFQPLSGNLPDGHYTMWIWAEGKFQNTPVVQSSLVVDTTAPAMPTGLSAKEENTQVTLTWTENSESDLDYYKVYQSGVLINGNVEGNTYTAASLTNDTLYSFTVIAVDSAGNESPTSVSISAAPSMPTLQVFFDGNHLAAGQEICLQVQLIYKDESIEDVSDSVTLQSVDIFGTNVIDTTQHPLRIIGTNTGYARLVISYLTYSKEIPIFVNYEEWLSNRMNATSHPVSISDVVNYINGSIPDKDCTGDGEFNKDDIVELLNVIAPRGEYI